MSDEEDSGRLSQPEMPIGGGGSEEAAIGPSAQGALDPREEPSGGARPPTRHRGVRAVVVIGILLGAVAAGLVYYLAPKTRTEYRDQDRTRKKAEGKVTWRGQRCGTWTYWWPNGQVKETGEYVEHPLLKKYRRDGTWKQWDREGNQVGECRFVQVHRITLPGVGGYGEPRHELEVLPAKGHVASFAEDGSLVDIKVYDVPVKEGETPQDSDAWEPVRVFEARRFRDTKALLRQFNMESGLRRAAAGGDVKAVRALISQGPSLLKSAVWKGITPMHLAAREGHVEAIKGLLAGGANVNGPSTEYDYWRPIHCAVENGKAAAVQFLVKAGAEVEQGNFVGRSPLDIAAQNDSVEIAKVLIAAGAKVNGRPKKHFKPTPLFHAAINGSLATMRLLIAEGADVNARDGNKRMPLFHAIMKGRLAAMELLIAKGADVNATDCESRTPLDCAVKQYDEKLAELLRKHGGRPGTKPADQGS